MNDFIITCSSTCDLTKEYLSEHKNPYVKYSFLLGDKIYTDDFYDNITIKEFYDKIKLCGVKTSQPEPAQYEEVWGKVLAEGKDVLHIELSSGISGAYASSLIIKEDLQEKYPDRKIIVIDSLCCSTGYGFLLKLANEKKESGADIDEVKNYVEEMKLKIHHVFIPNIEQLVKGGRIPAPLGIVAKAINIVPILYVDSEGKLDALSKTRGINKAMTEIKNYISEHIQNSEEYDERFLIEHIYADDVYMPLYKDLQEIYKKAKFSEKEVYHIGSVIGAHVGPGTFGIFFIGGKRKRV